MKKIASFVSVALLICGSSLTHAHKEHEHEVSQFDQIQRLSQIAATIATSIENNQLRPMISKEGITDASHAYFIQKQSNNLLQKKSPIVGFKAGLTSIAGQKKFKVSTPLLGALYATIPAKQDIKLDAYHKLMLETEIGFILANDIPPYSTLSKEILNSLIESAVPVIELPNLAFSDLKQVTGLDLVASNVASNAVIIGDFKLPKDFDALNQLSTTLVDESNPEQLLIRGKGSDASNDQASALLWLINTASAQGYQLKKGQLLITGALGPMVPAKKGHFIAQFSEYGRISFNIK